MTRSVLLTGATGFIGSHVLRLLSADPDLRVRATVHNRPAVDETVTWIAADLADPAPWRGICDGVEVVLHLASYVGADADLCETVNKQGTKTVVAEAIRARVPVVYLSTAAVYGEGIHRGIVENAITPAPVSPVSASRLASEHTVLAANGIVLRPMFVYGTGDKWFLPAVASTMLAPAGLATASGKAQLSVIDAVDLARLIHAIAREPQRLAPSTMYHANHPHPVSYADLTHAVTSLIGAPPATANLPTARVLSLLTSDHWYASGTLWRRLGLSPGIAAPEGIAQHADWYRQILS